MRRILYLCTILAIALMFSGCTQQPATPAQTPVPTVATPATLSPAVSPTMSPDKHLNFTVTESKTDLTVQYNGGPDAADLTALIIRIDNLNGQVVIEREEAPSVGQKYVFPYQGNADASYVNIIGVFKDGSEHTVYMNPV